MLRLSPRLAVLAFLLTACSSDKAAPEDDSEPNEEAEPSPVGRDAATADAARTTRDAASPPRDADNPSSLDAAPSEDASAAEDASAPDAARDASVDAATDAGQPKFTPAYHIPLRVHRADSGLSTDALSNILNEVNDIWWSQAAVCFEIEVVTTEQKRTDGFDLWFHRSTLGCNTTANGVYCGDHDVHSLDMPSLGKANNAAWNVKLPPARTAAHELGHGLGLQHYNGFADSNDSLMSSGRQGFLLHDSEVTTARARAKSKAANEGPSSPCTKVSL